MSFTITKEFITCSPYQCDVIVRVDPLRGEAVYCNPGFGEVQKLEGDVHVRILFQIIRLTAPEVVCSIGRYLKECSLRELDPKIKVKPKKHDSSSSVNQRSSTSNPQDSRVIEVTQQFSLNLCSELKVLTTIEVQEVPHLVTYPEVWGNKGASFVKREGSSWLIVSFNIIDIDQEVIYRDVKTELLTIKYSV